jgi:hypothetical protein
LRLRREQDSNLAQTVADTKGAAARIESRASAVALNIIVASFLIL